MANDYTNTGEHYLPVPAITDQFSYSRDISTLRIQLNKGLAGVAAYDSSGSNYVLAAANAGAILSSVGASPRGRVIGAASGQDPTLSFQLHTGAALATAWTLGVDDSDSDIFKIESDATIGTAPEFTLKPTSGDARILGDLIVQGANIGLDADTDLIAMAVDVLSINGSLGVGIASPAVKFQVENGYLLVNWGGSPGVGSGIRIASAVSSTHYNWMIGAQNNVNAGFEITPSTATGGTTFSTPALVCFATGAVGIGTTTGPSAAGAGTLVFGDKAEPTLAANTAGLYADDVAGTVEMFAVDEAGNQVQLTQHDETTGEVIHRSTNSYSGREILIWMERAFRDLETLTGKRYVIETWRPVERCRDWNTVQAQQAVARDAEIAEWDALDVTSKRDRRAPTSFVVKPIPVYIEAAMRSQGRAV